MSGLTKASNHYCNLRKRKKQDDKMKILQWLFRAFILFCALVIVGFSGWILYFVWWIVKGMR